MINQNSQQSTLESLSPQFIWCADSCELYKLALTSPEVKFLLDSFMKFCNNDNINAATRDLQAVLLKTTGLSLKMRRVKKKKVKLRTSNKNWSKF